MYFARKHILICLSSCLLLIVLSVLRTEPDAEAQPYSGPYPYATNLQGGIVVITNTGTSVTITLAPSSGLLSSITANSLGINLVTAPCTQTFSPAGFILSSNIYVGSGYSGVVVNSNHWSLASVTNNVPNFGTILTSSNGYPVAVYSSNGVAFVYYLLGQGSQIIP